MLSLTKPLPHLQLRKLGNDIHVILVMWSADCESAISLTSSNAVENLVDTVENVFDTLDISSDSMNTMLEAMCVLFSFL